MTIIESSPLAHPVSQPGPRPTQRSRARLPFVVCALLAAVLMFANYILAIPFGVVTQGLGWGKDNATVDALMTVVVSLLTLVAAVILVGLVTRWVLRGGLRDIGLVRTNESWRMFLIGWATVAVLMVTCELVMEVAGVQRSLLAEDDLPLKPLAAVVAGVVARIFTAVAMQGLPEELVFRGWLMSCLAHRPRLALVASSLVFGLLHLVSTGGQHSLDERLLYLVLPIGFGFLAGAMALRLRSLWAAVGVHAGLHLTTTVLLFTPLVADGPVVWVGEGLAFVLAGLLVLRGWHGAEVVMDR